MQINAQREVSICIYKTTGLWKGDGGGADKVISTN